MLDANELYVTNSEKVNILLDTLPRLQSLEVKEPNWFWPSLLAEGAFHIISGEPGSMKSMLAFYMALGLSNGNLFGSPSQTRPVIYVDRENPDVIVKQRFDNFKVEKADNLWYWGMWYQHIEPPFAISTIYEDFVKQIQDKSGERPVIIFDSLVRFHNQDENDAGAMSKVTSAFRKLTAIGATVVVLHHKGKPKTDGPTSPYRGTSEIAGACDIAYSITKAHNTLDLQCFKNRFEEEKGMKVQFNVTENGALFVPDNIIEHKQAGISIPNEPVEVTILKHLIKKAPGINVQQLIDKSKIGQHKCRDILSSGKDIYWLELVEDFNKKTYIPIP